MGAVVCGLSKALWARLDRPGLDRLRDGAGAGAFEAALVLCPDRLARKYAYQILILEELERFDVQVISLDQPLSDDPQARLLTQIQGAVAGYERIKIAERYRRGKLFRARQGEVCWWKVPYGYRRIPPQVPRSQVGPSRAARLRCRSAADRGCATVWRSRYIRRPP